MEPPPLAHTQRKHGYRHTLIEQRRQAARRTSGRLHRRVNESHSHLGTHPLYHKPTEKSRGKAKKEVRESAKTARPGRLNPRLYKISVLRSRAAQARPPAAAARLRKTLNFVSAEGANRGGDHSQDKSPPRGKAPDARVIAETAARPGWASRAQPPHHTEGRSPGGGGGGDSSGRAEVATRADPDSPLAPMIGT